MNIHSKNGLTSFQALQNLGNSLSRHQGNGGDQNDVSTQFTDAIKLEMQSRARTDIVSISSSKSNSTGREYGLSVAEGAIRRGHNLTPLSINPGGGTQVGETPNETPNVPVEPEGYVLSDEQLANLETGINATIANLQEKISVVDTEEGQAASNAAIADLENALVSIQNGDYDEAIETLESAALNVETSRTQDWGSSRDVSNEALAFIDETQQLLTEEIGYTSLSQGEINKITSSLESSIQGLQQKLLLVDTLGGMFDVADAISILSDATGSLALGNFEDTLDQLAAASTSLESARVNDRGSSSQTIDDVLNTISQVQRQLS